MYVIDLGLYKKIVIAFGVGLVLCGLFFQYSLKNWCIFTLCHSVETYITVSIFGGISSPGVYRLLESSTLSDLIDRAGGLVGGNDLQLLSQINIAEELKDNTNYIIPFVSEDTNSADFLLTYYDISPMLSSSTIANRLLNQSSSSVSSSGTTSANSSESIPNSDNLTNINNASEELLIELPGIGKTYATKIMSSRPFLDISDLTTRSGVPSRTIENVKDLITF